MEENVEKKVLPVEVFNFLKEKCPDFLRSYYVLSHFYTVMTEQYTHKAWKDGRIVLNPKPKEEHETN